MYELAILFHILFQPTYHASDHCPHPLNIVTSLFPDCWSLISTSVPNLFQNHDMYTYVQAYMYTYIQAYISCSKLHLYICIYMCLCVCVYIYIYIYIYITYHASDHCPHPLNIVTSLFPDCWSLISTSVPKSFANVDSAMMSPSEF
jgi:hypothetical protein